MGNCAVNGRKKPKKVSQNRKYEQEVLWDS
jgi:hypothetical protein